ncbi:hypothetical protein [Photorhabdus luminescens]
MGTDQALTPLLTQKMTRPNISPSCQSYLPGQSPYWHWYNLNLADEIW